MTKRRLISVLLALSMLLTLSLSLCACDEDDGEKTPKEYSVTLVDVENKPVSGVIVTVFNGTEKMGMKPTGADGKAVFELEKASYTFTLTYIGDDAYACDESKLVLTEENPSITVTLCAEAVEKYALYNGSEAGIIEDGTYYVEFSSDKPTYFLYTPMERGRYKISCESEVITDCSYLGSAIYIYENDISNETDREQDGSIYMDFRKYNINQTQYLFGVTGETAGNGYFTIEKVSDLEYIPEELDWTEYQKTHEIKDFTFPGGTLTNFDVTAAGLSAVYNEDDGYYHLNSKNGPVLYVNLTTPSAYNIALEKICETQPFHHYVYDEDGNFLYKITYQKMMLDYIEAADDNVGVYPMTYDLALAIKSVGNALGWYKASASDGTNAFFAATPVTPNSWLFACCYVAG